MVNDSPGDNYEMDIMGLVNQLIETSNPDNQYKTLIMLFSFDVFQELLWPELIVSGVLELNWKSYFVIGNRYEHDENLIGVSNHSLPFLSDSGNWRIDSRWHENRNSNLESVIEIERQYGANLADFEGHGSQELDDYDEWELHKFDEKYPIFLANSGYQLTEEGLWVVSDYLENRFQDEPDTWDSIVKVELNVENLNVFDFSWRNLPEQVQANITNVMIINYLKFSRGLTEYKAISDWNQDAQYYIDQENYIDDNLFPFSNIFIDQSPIGYTPDALDPSGLKIPLPPNFEFCGNSEADLRDISLHFNIEIILCLVALHPATSEAAKIILLQNREKSRLLDKTLRFADEPVI